MRLTRSGDTLTGYDSADGIRWTRSAPRTWPGCPPWCRPGCSPLNGSARTPQPSVDGRIGISQSTPSWLDTRSKPLGRFETVDVLSIHNARVSLEGSNSFVARSAPEAVFDDFAEADVLAGDFLPPKLQTHSGRWLGVTDSRGGPRYQDGQFRVVHLEGGPSDPGAACAG